MLDVHRRWQGNSAQGAIFSAHCTACPLHCIAHPLWDIHALAMIKEDRTTVLSRAFDQAPPSKCCSQGY